MSANPKLDAFLDQLTADELGLIRYALGKVMEQRSPVGYIGRQARALYDKLGGPYPGMYATAGEA